jgi:epidermal growth factor receptor substrate 15
MLQSKLPGDVLASIWDLADLNNDGRITRDGFAVAFHLIQGKLTGKEIPTTLPASLMPPSMRVVAVPTASPFQQPPSDLLNDLLWEDSPVTSHPQPTTLQPQRTGHTQSSAISAPQTQGQSTFASNKDLLDDDDDDAGVGTSTTINDHSAEIGNLQNQLQSTTRSLENTRAERNNVEITVQNQAAQLSALQTQLGSAKAAYGAESRLLASLHERFSNQSSEIQKVKEELIRAESELSAIRLEKAEVEQNLLHDKEEIRDLQRKMTETGSTIEVVKAEVEKAQKEAKQQKGLLVIAKKQLATREAERAKISQELREVVAEAEEVTREREMTEAELLKEPTAINVSNGLPFAPSPSLSGDGVPFSAAQPHPGSPGSPSSVSGSLTAKSNNPFERIAAGSGRQSPFLPSSVPTPAVVTSPQNEGTTTDNPFTFDQAFGDEEARPGPDVEEPSTGPETNVQPSTSKIVGEPRIAVNEEVSEPSSDHDLFITPPTSALDALGANSITLAAEPDSLKRPPPDATSLVPSTDRPPEAHTDINSQLNELDANESDSSDEDSEDETPLATLVGLSHPAGAAKGAVSNGHASPRTAVEAAFPPVVAVVAAAEAQSTNPFPPLPAKDNSPFPASTSPFAVSPPEPPKVATLSDFDKAFGDFPGTAPTAGGKNASFDNVFEDQFDFTKAEPSASLPAISVSSSGSSAFPPAPTNSGIVKSSISPVRETGFENAFKPPQKTASSVRPVSAVDGLPVLPPVPESRPFSFVQAFSSDLSSSAPAITEAPTHTTPSQPPPVPDAPTPSFDDAYGLNGAQTDSGFGTTSSRTSSIPLAQSPLSTTPTSNPIRGSTSPRDTVNFPVSPPHGTPPVSSPPRVSSPPKGRPSTSSSKESGKEQGRHSKLSIRLPFGKKKKTQDSLPPPPSQHLSPIVDESIRRASPAVEDDVEPVKQLCSMGFSRTRAVAALEASSYDFQKALNSLLNP